ncbi:MAG: hypothetical protein JO359_11370 [Candidatus Eremiobacteraeota bacterium]|nr:hypothetical protein [Candidatus Eremiobacteraeota bacterium]
MSVDWGVVSAVSTMVSTVVIAIAALLALGQLRQMHRAGQFDVTRKMIEEIKNPAFVRAWTYVIKEFPARAGDPAYRAELGRTRSWEVELDRHPEILVLAYLEELGIYVKQRLIAENALLDFNCGLILEAWERLEPVVKVTREMQDPNAWYNTEFLAGYARERSAGRGATVR